MSVRSRIFSALGVLALIGGAVTGAAAITAGSASASTPLPAYPAVTTLDLGSPGCVTDDVIMNDPLDSTSPITDTYGSASGKISHPTPPVHYYLWYLNSGNTWIIGNPPGVSVNSATGVISADSSTITAPTSDTTVTYTVRDHGKDSVGAVGTEQFQLRVNNSGGTAGVTTVTYEGNTFNNADGALTIQLNAGSSDSTALTLNAIASSLGIPGSTPVTFTLVSGSYPAWKLNGGTTGTVLTGVSASDPNIEAVTANHDVVFFHLSGISTDAGGVFFTNSDANPCVTGPAPAPSPSPTASTPPPPPVTSAFGDFMNPYGNGPDVYRQHFAYNGKIAGWPATQHDVATRFQQLGEGTWNGHAVFALEAGSTGWCVSDPMGGSLPAGADPYGLVLRSCNAGPFQLYWTSGGYLFSVAFVQRFGSGGYVDPAGTGGQLSVGASPVGWGGSHYTWVPEANLPA